MIAIIDGCGSNIASIHYAFDRLGVDTILTDDAEKIRTASHVILPGVGHAEAVMAVLREKQLDQLIPRLQQPVLGICLGMQLLYQHTEEGDTDGLGIIPQTIKRFPASTPIIPHMGWNQLQLAQPNHPLLQNIPQQAYVYFVHGYRAPVSPNTLASTDYGEPFSAIVQQDNFYGMQFHPERSAQVGETLLNNFVRL